VRYVAFGAFVLWAFFSKLLSIFLTDAVENLLHVLEQWAIHRGGHPEGPLTADERVSHILCDSDEDYAERIARCFGVAVFCLPFTLFGWLQRSSDLLGPFLWPFLLSAPAFLVLCFIGITRFILRAAHRYRIAVRLSAERKQWDPVCSNPGIFVSRRDSDPTAMALFDALTMSCYRRGLTVLQYTDFEWPVYRMGESPVNKDLSTLEHPNPNAVRKARAVVWLDIGKTSRPMRQELEVARRRDLPMIRVRQAEKASGTFRVTDAAGSSCVSRYETLPDTIAGILEGVIHASSAKEKGPA
jgi:hypothetical protein